jgi:hypothetical protein
VLAFISFLFNFKFLFWEYYCPLLFLLLKTALIEYFELVSLLFYFEFALVNKEPTVYKDYFGCYDFSYTKETSLNPSSHDYMAYFDCMERLIKLNYAIFGYFQRINHLYISCCCYCSYYDVTLHFLQFALFE